MKSTQDFTMKQQESSVSEFIRAETGSSKSRRKRKSPPNLEDTYHFREISRTNATVLDPETPHTFVTPLRLLAMEVWCLAK